MTAEEYDMVSECINRHLIAMNEELAAMVAVVESSSPPPAGV